MESSYTGIDALRPWRTTAIVAGGVAAVELVLLVVAAVALFGPSLKGHADAATPKATEAAPARTAPAAKPRRAAPVPTTPRLSRRATSVLVLNGNGVAGAAGSAAGRVHAKGYTVASTTNASRNDYARSIVMYRRGYAPEAKRLARDLGIRIVGPLDGLRPGELMGAHLALIVGRR